MERLKRMTRPMVSVVVVECSYSVETAMEVSSCYLIAEDGTP